MPTVVGIRFKKACKIYYFDPATSGVAKGDHAIVETARGVENGVDSLLYSSDEEAFEMMKFYLSHDDALEQIRENAFKKVRSDFTIEERLQTMVKTLNEN